MAVLFPAPFSAYYDDNGDPLSGGFVYTYVANSSTPLATYTDSTGNTANANPVELDAAGRANIWFDGAKLYKIVLKDADGVTIKTVDNVGMNSSGLYFSPAGTSAVSRTVQSKLRETVSVYDFGAVGDGVTDDTAAIQAALDSSNDNLRVTLAGGTFYCTNTITVKGTGKVLDGENGTLLFGGATDIYCVKITSRSTAPAPNYGASVRNLVIQDSGLSGTSNVGLLIIGKADLTVTENLRIRSVSGTAFWVQGGVSGASNNSPEKGCHSNIFVDSCTNGFRIDSGSDINGLLTHHVFKGCYVATVGASGKAYYVYNAAECSFLGCGGETGGAGSYGIYIDDNSVGGGHVFSGGFIEGYTTNFYYAAPNPSNGDVVLVKGARGGALNSTNLFLLPGTVMGSVQGLVQRNVCMPVFDLNTATPLQISTDPYGVIAVIKDRKGMYGRFYLSCSDGTLATASVEIMEQSTANLFTTSSGTANKCNVYATAGVGFYIENNARDVGGTGNHSVLSLQLLSEG